MTTTILPGQSSTALQRRRIPLLHKVSPRLKNGDSCSTDARNRTCLSGYGVRSGNKFPGILYAEHAKNFISASRKTKSTLRCSHPVKDYGKTSVR
jgi:hypothetical protein